MRFRAAHSLVLLCAFALTLSGCASARRPELYVSGTISGEELALYRPILAIFAERMRTNFPSNVLLVQDVTEVHYNDHVGAIGFRRKDSELLILEVALHLRKRDHLRLDLPLDPPLRSVAPADVPDLRKRRPHDLIYGVLQLSPPGYSWDGRTAIIETGVYCGMLCGYGELFILQKTGDRWEIRERIDTWIS